MADCTACDLCKKRGKHQVLGRGNLKAELAIVLPNPNTRDAECGYALSKADDAKLLQDMLDSIGLKREQVFITHLVRCNPYMDPKSGEVEKVTDQQIAACHANLDKELSYVKPKIVLAMGAAPAARILGAKSLASVEGRVVDSKDALGFSFALSGESKEVTRKKEKVTVQFNKPEAFKVIATYAPAMVTREPKYLANIKRAFQTVDNLLTGKVAEEKTYDYKYAYTEEEVYKMLSEILQRCNTSLKMVFDIETSGFNWFKRKFSDHVAKVLSCGFCFKEYEAYGVSFRPQARSVRNIDLFKQVMEHPIFKGGHNGKFDNVFIRGEFGFTVKNFSVDTMVLAYMLDQGSRVGLAELSPIYRPDQGHYWEEVEKKYLDKKKTGYLKCPDNILLEYNCRDVDVTMTLWNRLEPLVRERNLWKTFETIAMPRLREIEKIEYRGIKIDVPATIELGKSLAKDVEEAEIAACAVVGRHPEWWRKTLGARGMSVAEFKPLNLGSSKQLGILLYEDLGLPVLKRSKKTKAPSTDAEVLEELADKHPFCKALLTYRKFQKLLSTYVGWEIRDDGTQGVVEEGASLLFNVDENDRVHTSYKVAHTATARLSSEAPNLQNIPKTKAFRGLFIAEKGFSLIDSDFAAVELRILAMEAKDRVMLQVFKDGVDPHSATAAKMFGLTLADFIGVDVTLADGTTAYCKNMEEAKSKYPDAKFMADRKDRKERKVGKAINFGIVYGEGAKKLGDSLDISKQEAQKYLDDWAKTYPEITAWLAKTRQEAMQTGRVRYSLGRERLLPGIYSNDNGVKAEAERQACNTKIQGTSADCTAIAEIRVGSRLTEEVGEDLAQIVLTVHDQLVTECRNDLLEKAMAIVIEEMEKQMPMLSDELPLAVDCSIKDSLGKGLK